MMSDFAGSLNDAQNLWLYQINTNSDICQMFGKMNNGKMWYFFYDPGNSSALKLMNVNDRINMLIEKYNWSDNSDPTIVMQGRGPSTPELTQYSFIISKAVNHIFSYCINEFSKIEAQRKIEGN